jgi:predicted dehydrogenase
MIQAAIKKGKVLPLEVPIPILGDSEVLIKVCYSAISVGTEMMNVTSTGKSILQKIKEQPENVKKVVDTLKKEGISKTYDLVHGKLENAVSTGYSVSGVVVAVGGSILKFKVGDKVAAAGAAFANHAEYVVVPENLIVNVPDSLSMKYASTVTLGAIALQSVRRSNIVLGNYCAVIGTGILGLLVVQLLQRSGARVIAIDIDDERLALAKALGAEVTINSKTEDFVKFVNQYTGGYGADNVIFSAATSNSKVLSDSFKICRKKGELILLGVSGMDIQREDIYPKELDFKISTSYGPGRYDDKYELEGMDYPYAYVRWTENRNMAEYLRLLSVNAISIEPLISALYKIEEVGAAYESLKQKNKSLFVLLEYHNETDFEGDLIKSRRVAIASKPTKKGVVNVALVGAGNFAVNTHLPNLKKLTSKYRLYCICNKTGVKSVNIADNYQCEYITSDIDEVLNDENVDLVLIATRHNNHAELVVRSLKAGKHVFVEKPLATNEKELEIICDFYENDKELSKPILFVGYNRRFSRCAQEIKEKVKNRINPMVIHYRMNAGYIPSDHWVHKDGGRIIGECCHVIDLVSFLIEANIEEISVVSLTPKNDYYGVDDNKSILLKYSDGSICTIEYFANGGKELPKERMEAHFDNKSIILDDYSKLEGYGLRLSSVEKPDKGHYQEWWSLYDSLTGKNSSWPISYDDLIQTSKATFLIGSI